MSRVIAAAIDYLVANVEAYKTAIRKRPEELTEEDRTLTRAYLANIRVLRDEATKVPSTYDFSRIRNLNYEGLLEPEVENALKTIRGGSDNVQAIGNQQTIGSQNTPNVNPDSALLSALSSMNIAKETVVCQAPDEMNEKQCKLFLDSLYQAFQTLVLKRANELTDQEKAIVFYSMCVSVVEHWTSKRNASNPDVRLEVTLNGAKHEVKKGDILDYIDRKFSEANEVIANPERRFFRTKNDLLKAALQAGGYKPTGRLASKHGALGNDKYLIGDATALYKQHLTSDQTNAALYVRDIATKSKQDANISHVAQLSGGWTGRK